MTGKASEVGKRALISTVLSSISSVFLSSVCIATCAIPDCATPDCEPPAQIRMFPSSLGILKGEIVFSSQTADLCEGRGISRIFRSEALQKKLPNLEVLR